MGKTLKELTKKLFKDAKYICDDCATSVGWKKITVADSSTKDFCYCCFKYTYVTSPKEWE